jgi:amino acid transporter
MAVIFLTVSGGPYGLESLLTHAGREGALPLLILTPLLWDIPTIFVVMELNSMMPVTGGYYQWVKKALGLRYAWYEGWWTWLYTFVDLAIYPVLFVGYASHFFPEIAHYRILICLVIIWGGAGLNILGIVPVGRTSLILSSAVVVPFVILFVIHVVNHHGLSIPPLSLKHIAYPSLGMALYTVMWNFIGWDNTTTYAEEVNKPVRTYLVATFAAFALTLGIYVISTITALSFGIDPVLLDSAGFPALGTLVGGNWLGIVLAVGGMASTFGLFSAVLLSVSRIPAVMSDDGLLPKKLHEEHPRFKTPYVSIVICAMIVSGMILWSFGDLIVIDVTLYGAALFLEFITLIVLRLKWPNEPRPFKIPVNVVGLCIITLIPFGVYGVALSSALISEKGMLIPAIFAIASLISAELVWLTIHTRRIPRSLS